MHIIFRCEQGEEVTAPTEELSTRGALVRSSRRPISLRDLEMHLSREDERLRVEAEVLRLSEEGFAVAFRALPPEDLLRLKAWLSPGAEPKNKDVAAKEGTGPRFMQDLLLRGWSPSLSEPTLHQWKPSEGLVQPANTAHPQQNSTWHNLATIAPTVAAPRPSQTPRQDAPASTHAAPAGNPASQPSPEAPAPQRSGGIEQRQDNREEKSIPVVFEDVTGLIKEFTHNISFGGMFTYTAKPFQVRDEVAVTLIHPVHQERLTLLATVMHTADAPSPDPVTGQARYGVGLQFRLPIEELKRLLSDFISSHKGAEKEKPDGELLVQARQILERAEQGHHALLNLSTEASVDEVRQAYFALVDRFHPDRYFGQVSDTTRKVLEDLFRQLTQAYEALCS